MKKMWFNIFALVALWTMMFMLLILGGPFDFQNPGLAMAEAIGWVFLLVAGSIFLVLNIENAVDDIIITHERKFMEEMNQRITKLVNEGKDHETKS